MAVSTRRYVIVTPAVARVGRATALAFARGGASVAVCDIMQDRALPSPGRSRERAGAPPSLPSPSATHYKQLKGERGLDHYEGRSSRAGITTPRRSPQRTGS
jgi:NAD(P)-dependent dehydrogenase (short-subunit alcohol dehydrogenase family)